MQRGELTLSIDIVEAEGEDYGVALEAARDLGSQTVLISLNWECLEPQPGVYDFSSPDIIETFYPTTDICVGLMLGPVNTNNYVSPDVHSLAILASSRWTVGLTKMQPWQSPSVRFRNGGFADYGEATMWSLPAAAPEAT